MGFPVLMGRHLHVDSGPGICYTCYKKWIMWCALLPVYSFVLGVAEYISEFWVQCVSTSFIQKFIPHRDSSDCDAIADDLSWNTSSYVSSKKMITITWMSNESPHISEKKYEISLEMFQMTFWWDFILWKLLRKFHVETFGTCIILGICGNVMAKDAVNQ